MLGNRRLTSFQIIKLGTDWDENESIPVFSEAIGGFIVFDRDAMVIRSM